MLIKRNKRGFIMSKKDLNDFIVEILQDFCEIQSLIKVLKDSVCNENNEITMVDVGNTLEILVAKASSAKYALEKYADFAF